MDQGHANAPRLGMINCMHHRLLSNAILILTTLLLSLSYTIAHDSGAYNHDRDAVADYPDWMRFLSDDMLVTNISWPGTHDTMATCNRGSDGDGCELIPIVMDKTQTQGMDLPKQLASGIRALDIRVKHLRQVSDVILSVTSFEACEEGDTDCKFTIWHDIIYLGANFKDDVMDKIAMFLNENPTESILMRLKKEGGDNYPLLGAAITNLLKMKYSSITLPYSCWNPSSTKLGNGTQVCDARGKVLIMPEGFDFDTSTSSNDPYIGFYKGVITMQGQTVQDAFTLGTNWDLYDKWSKVKDHFNVAVNGNPHRFYFNYLSGSGGSFPYFVASGHSSPGTGAPQLATGLATPFFDSSYPDFPHTTCLGIFCTISFEGTNVLASNVLRDNYAGKRVGVIMSDFPGRQLIEHIIQANIDGVTGVAISLKARVENKPPIANLLAPIPVEEGSPNTFDATASSDPDGEMLGYNWELVGASDCMRSAADGASIKAYNEALVQFAKANPSLDPTALAIAFSNSTEGIAALKTLSENPDELGKATFECSDNQNAMVKVTISDRFEDVAATADFSILNVAPVVVSATGVVIDENSVASITVSITDPGTLDTFNVNVNWGDGSTNTYTQPASSLDSQTVNYTHQYLDDGTDPDPSFEYTVNIGVQDNDGGAGSTETKVTVNNVDPEAAIESVLDDLGNRVGEDGGVNVLLINLEMRATVSFTDIGTLDTHEALVDWGDNKTWSGPTTSPATWSHIYFLPANYTLKITITDDDSGQADVSQVIQVVDSVGAVAHAIVRLHSIAEDPTTSPQATVLLNNALAALEGIQIGSGSKNGGGSKKKKGARTKTVMEASTKIGACSANFTPSSPRHQARRTRNLVRNMERLTI